MKRKIKDPIQKRWTKLRSAIRNVWQYDPSRKEVIKKAAFKDTVPTGNTVFICPICQKAWPIELATVDHDPPLGSFNSWETFFKWTRQCFEGPQRAICKPCHRKVTNNQRRKVHD